ncbi:hypothetical protein TIFTF001_054852 [Ficus carica]|uniref:Uncharacterized protein n=1 Tax=Ficus carica TaxID=3494 RepID=A0AA88JG55_FICCA|nr:hypothetical protein TIFTF001_054852 [Ficus carica]
MVSSPYQGSCFAKQRVAVSIKLERSWVFVSRFGVGFRHVVGVLIGFYPLTLSHADDHGRDLLVHGLHGSDPMHVFHVSQSELKAIC